jgi:23S rRNA (guanosine2251-2'-O)-methyltransferase
VGKLLGIHSIREALEAGRAIERIVVARGRGGDRIEEIVRLARQRNVPVRFEDRTAISRLAGTEQHQGIVALAGAKRAATIEDVIAGAGPDALVVLLDGVEDPHNLGAILRSALAAGAVGAVIPERRAAGLTETVARASAGALEHLPVARVTNLVRAMEELKEAGFWLVGLDERGEQVYSEATLTGRIGLVLGGEGKGLHDLTRKRCDFVVSIPTGGPVRSLNVSVAAGVVLFEAVRQRRQTASRKKT